MSEIRSQGLHTQKTESLDYRRKAEQKCQETSSSRRAYWTRMVSMMDAQRASFARKDCKARQVTVFECRSRLESLMVTAEILKIKVYNIASAKSKY